MCYKPSYECPNIVAYQVMNVPTLCLLIAGAALSVTGCEYGWATFKDKCYQYHTDERGWESAVQQCKSDDAVLATARTAGTNTFLKALAVNKGATKFVWLNAHDKPQGVKVYRWQDTQDKDELNYTNWTPGNPSNTGGNEHCLELISSREGKNWNDNECDNGNNYICEKQDSDARCQGRYSDWTKYKSHCYRHFDRLTTWTLARADCEAKGANLASSLDDDENNFLRSFYGEINDKDNVWLGGYDYNTESYWSWTDGSDFNVFNNWVPGEPDNHEGKEHYLQMRWSDGKWRDTIVTNTWSFICKTKYVPDQDDQSDSDDPDQSTKPNSPTVKPGSTEPTDTNSTSYSDSTCPPGPCSCTSDVITAVGVTVLLQLMVVGAAWAYVTYIKDLMFPPAGPKLKTNSDDIEEITPSPTNLDPSKKEYYNAADDETKQPNVQADKAKLADDHKGLHVPLADAGSRTGGGSVRSALSSARPNKSTRSNKSARSVKSATNTDTTLTTDSSLGSSSSGVNPMIRKKQEDEAKMDAIFMMQGKKKPTGTLKK